MKAIAIITGIICSVTLGFAQEGAAKSAPSPATGKSENKTEKVAGSGGDLSLLEVLQKGGWAMIPLGGFRWRRE